jgi:hypothetical protein
LVDAPEAAAAAAIAHRRGVRSLLALAGDLATPELARAADAPSAERVYVRVVRVLLRSHGDRVLAAAVAVVYVLEVSFESDVTRREPSALAALAFAASLLVRRRLPLVPLLAGLAVIELDNTALKGLAEAGTFLVAFIVALYSAGRWARGRMFAASCLVVVAAIPLAAIEPGQPVGFGDVAFFLVFFGGRSSRAASSAIAANASG